MGGANTSFRLAKKTLAQQAGNSTSNSTATIRNVTKPADLEIASAPYNCTGAANGTSVNKFDGLIHNEDGKRTFSEDGCVVGGVNDSYKHTGHPLNKTKIAEDAGESTSTNSTTSANTTSSSNSTIAATPVASSNSTSGSAASNSTASASTPASETPAAETPAATPAAETPATEVPSEVAATLTQKKSSEGSVENKEEKKEGKK